MFRKYSIIALFLFAYTIVLAHVIIPHHHHNDGHDMELSSQHHNQDNHNDGHHNDRDSGDNDLAAAFEYYNHSGTTGDPHQQPDIKVSADTLATAYLISAYTFQLNVFEQAPTIVRHSNDYIPTTRHFLSSKGLRAPPCTLI